MPPMTYSTAVIIPCYGVKNHVLDVILHIGQEVQKIYVVDDACPQQSGSHVLGHCTDARVKVLFHERNMGVGAAVMTGYAEAMKDGAQVMVKLDGDGQMDPALISKFVSPILLGQADYTKGNRFYDLTHLGQMPRMRLFGNAVLSFMAKLSTGYWNLFDINNGFTAIHSRVAKRLPLHKISQRYYFESDMLFRLGTVRAVVVDVVMDAKYANETSHLKIRQIAAEFMVKHVVNFFKRIFYNYFLRDMSVASLELFFGLLLLVFGTLYGVIQWSHAVASNTATPLGTIMLAALPTLVGLQLLLAFVAYDIASIPRRPIHPDLA